MTHIISRLKEVNEIVYVCSGGTIPFEQANVIARFYYDFQETNLLIAEAETMASESDRRLKEIAVSLKKESSVLRLFGEGEMQRCPSKDTGDEGTDKNAEFGIIEHLHDCRIHTSKRKGGYE